MTVRATSKKTSALATKVLVNSPKRESERRARNAQFAVATAKTTYTTILPRTLSVEVRSKTAIRVIVKSATAA
jgi:hypothetical protein